MNHSRLVPFDLMHPLGIPCRAGNYAENAHVSGKASKGIQPSAMFQSYKTAARDSAITTTITPVGATAVQRKQRTKPTRNAHSHINVLPIPNS